MDKATRLFLKVDLLNHELRDDLDAMVEADRKKYGEMTVSEFIRKMLRDEKIRRKQLAIYHLDHKEWKEICDAINEYGQFRSDAPLQET